MLVMFRLDKASRLETESGGEDFVRAVSFTHVVFPSGGSVMFTVSFAWQVLLSVATVTFTCAETLNVLLLTAP